LRLDVAAANNDIGTIAGNAVDSHPDEGGPGLEDVGIGGHLGYVEHDRTIVVDGIGVVQLQRALAHVHGMRGPTWADDSDLGIVGSGVGGTGIGRSGDGDIKVFAAVSECVGNTRRDRTV